MAIRTGVGATNFVVGLPEHNPKPRTERGKRRHANRNPERKKIAESAWEKGRSTRLSKKQKELQQFTYGK